MDHRHLEIFLETCRTASMSKAAEHLNISQPAVSIAIRELEAYYRVRLFERISRRIDLTEEGELLRSYAESVFGQAQEIEEVLREGKGIRHLSVGMNVTVAEEMQSDLIRQAEKKMPDTEIRWFVNDSQEVLRRIRDNRLDCGIVDEMPQTEGLWSQKLKEEKMYAIVAADDIHREIGVKDLQEMKFLLREEGSGARRFADSLFAEKGIQAEIVSESDSDWALLNLAEEGIGTAFLPERLASMAEKRWKVRKLPLKGMSGKRSYHLVRREEKYLSPALKELIECMENKSLW